MRKKTKYIFLDRDGVINVDVGNGYVDNWKKFRFLPGSPEALRLLRKGGYRVIVVSNQAGVAKGFYSLRDLREITRRIKRKVEDYGGKLDAIYYCPHQREDRCRCRKPKTELFRKAGERFGINFKETTLIGDSLVDIAAGKALKCQTILVLSGREKLSRKRDWELQPDHIKKNLLAAVRWLLRQEEHRKRP